MREWNQRPINTFVPLTFVLAALWLATLLSLVETRRDLAALRLRHEQVLKERESCFIEIGHSLNYDSMPKYCEELAKRQKAEKF